MPFASNPQAVEDSRAGRMLVIVDDEDRGRYDRLHESAFEYAWLLSQVGITK